MWTKFVGSNEDAGLAVGTTIRQLKAVLDHHESPSNIGRAQYDYSPDAVGHVAGHRLYLRKRPEFAHEKEVRAVLCDPRPGVLPGIILLVDHAAFVEEIRLCPHAPTWFRELVEDAAYGAGVTRGCIRRSSLDDRPPQLRCDD